MAESNQNYSYPSNIQDSKKELASLSKILLESSNTISALRREFKGEALMQLPDGSSLWVQVSKPLFVEIDYEKNKPKKKIIKIPIGTKQTGEGENIKEETVFEEREIYVANDEAVEEVLQMIKFMGLNQVTPITKLKEDIILDDLRLFECKMAAVLALKQKKWGIDKELLPILFTKISTIVQDARYQAREGAILQALITSVQRIEHASEGEQKQKKLGGSPYG